MQFIISKIHTIDQCSSNSVWGENILQITGISWNFGKEGRFKGILKNTIVLYSASGRNGLVVDSVQATIHKTLLFLLREYTKVFVYLNDPCLIGAAGKMYLVHSSKLRTNFSLEIPLRTRIALSPLNQDFQIIKLWFSKLQVFHFVAKTHCYPRKMSSGRCILFLWTVD